MTPSEKLTTGLLTFVYCWRNQLTGELITAIIIEQEEIFSFIQHHWSVLKSRILITTCLGSFSLMPYFENQTQTVATKFLVDYFQGYQLNLFLLQPLSFFDSHLHKVNELVISPYFYPKWKLALLQRQAFARAYLHLQNISSCEWVEMSPSLIWNSLNNYNGIILIINHALETVTRYSSRKLCISFKAL